MREHLSSLSYWLKSPFLDFGGAEETTLLIGMGRSGTTWVANIINHDKSYRVLFEPFLPAKVSAAKPFKYIQYMRSDDQNIQLTDRAKKIFAGKIRSRWVDQDNKHLFYRRRIIKDIRCNLMAAWLRRAAHCKNVVVLIRHPLQVALSWRKLGWGREAMGEKSDFDIITSQARLLKDFPIIKNVAAQIDGNNLLERLIFQWGVFCLVPFSQLRGDEAYCLFYENLLIKPEEECGRLFNYLQRPYSWEQVKDSVKAESSTNFLCRSPVRDQSLLVEGWKSEFSAEEIQRTNEILSMFGLNRIYNDQGLPLLGNLFGL